MPNFTPVEPLDDGCVLGYSVSRKSAVWYVRMYWRDGNPPQSVYKSCGVPYEDSKASRNKAKRKANQLWKDHITAVVAGDSPIKARSIKSVADSYAKQIRAWAEENERTGKHIHFIQGGRNVKGHSQHWTTAKVKKIDGILKYLTGYTDGNGNYQSGFFDSLPTQDFRKITQRDLARFSQWAALNHDWSPSWTHQIITQIRMMYRYAFEQEWVDFIPSPFRPPAQTEERAGRNLKEEEWLMMVRYARDKYESIDPKNKSAAYNKDAALQFWAWLNIISWSGVRPASGKVIKNLMRWDDIRETDAGARIMIRKDKTAYEAPILEPAYPFLDFLKSWQKERGIDSPYIFAHTREKTGIHKKGDPIKSFKKQWETMLVALDLWNGEWGLPRSEKLVPYSLRGFFITMSLRNGVDLEKLSRSLGTSSRVVSQSYYDFQTEKEIDELIKRSGIADIGSVSYDDAGYPILS